MDNKSTTKRMIGAVVLVLIAALLLAWLLKGKNRPAEQKDLIAEQTQESTPILGFPGVKEENAQNGEGSLAAAAGSATTDTAAGTNQEYAIGTNAGAGTAAAGGASTATDPAAQQQAQSVLGAQDPNTSMPIADPNSSNAQAGAGATTANDQGSSAGAGAIAAATGAVAGAVESGKQAVQGVTSQMQSDTTGFQIRDPQKGEVREVVENGQKQPGVGNMGANATVAATNNAGKATSGESAKTVGSSETATKVPASGSSTTSTTSNKTASSSSNSAGSASTKDRPAVSPGDLKPENPRLVNERPVPAPAVQPRNTASTNRPATVEHVTTTSRPAEKPAPTVTAVNSAASGYVIQVLATSDKAKADDIKTTMSAEGYPVFVASAKVDGKTVYRVRVGTYPGKGDAAAVQARMKARYAQNQYVQNSFVTKN